VRFDVLRGVLIKIKVFWDMMLCRMLVIHHFKGTCMPPLPVHMKLHWLQ